MNSKSEYNRCKVPRITVETENETFKRLKLEVEKEKVQKNSIKVMKKRKNKPNNHLKEVCEELIKENRKNWNNRKKTEDENRSEIEKVEKESM